MNVPERSAIVLSNDFEREIKLLNGHIKPENLRIFDANELRTKSTGEHGNKKCVYVKDIVEEAHISTTNKKYIAIIANTFSVDAQNALLKIIEEPPRNIVFLLYANGRNKIIPTIRSRLITMDRRERRTVNEFEIDLSSLSMPVVCRYINKLEWERVDSNKAKGIVHSILISAFRSDINLTKAQLNIFQSAIDSLNKKMESHIAVLPVLLSLLPKNVK